jgi:integrating conjugative element protein (TIGR03757 family)
MKNIVSKLILCTLCSVINTKAIAAPRALPDSIIVITADDVPVRNLKLVSSTLSLHRTSISIFNLDDLSRFEHSLNEGIPANEEEAKTLFQSRLKNVGKEAFDKQLMEAHSAIVQSIKYEINQYPVVIFNEAAAVYGVTDLNSALKIYLQHSQKNIQSKGNSQ